MDPILIIVGWNKIHLFKLVICSKHLSESRAPTECPAILISQSLYNYVKYLTNSILC